MQSSLMIHFSCTSLYESNQKLYCPFIYRYKARIDAITNDGMVAISFEAYGSSDVTKLSLLKDVIDAAPLLAAAQAKGPRSVLRYIIRNISYHINTSTGFHVDKPVWYTHC